MEILTDIALSASIKLLVFGNAVAVLIGLLALCAPHLLKRLNTVGDTWFSTRNMGRPLDNDVDTDHLFLKYSRVLGVVLILVSILILVKGGGFFIGISVAAGAQLMADLFPMQLSMQSFWELIWLSSGMLIFLGAVVGIVLGIIAISNDELLARLNIAASRNFSTRKWSNRWRSCDQD